MSDPAATRLAPETDASIRESLDALGRAVQIARITNDPLLHTLEALASTVRAQHRLFVDGTLTLRQVLSEAQPLSAEERAALLREVSASAKDGADAGTHRAANRIVRSFDRKTAKWTGAWIGVAFVAGAAMATAVAFWGNVGRFSPDAAWREIVRLNPDPRPALQQAEIRSMKGRRYRSVALWMDPEPAPPSN